MLFGGPSKKAKCPATCRGIEKLILTHFGCLGQLWLLSGGFFISASTVPPSHGFDVMQATEA